AIAMPSARRAALWAWCAAAIERSRLASGEGVSPLNSPSRPRKRVSKSAMASPSGQVAQAAQREQAVAPAAPPVGPGRTESLAKRLPERMAAGQHARDIAGIGKAFDRPVENLDYDPDGPAGQRCGVVEEGGRNFKAEGLHFGRLRTK